MGEQWLIHWPKKKSHDSRPHAMSCHSQFIPRAGILKGTCKDHKYYTDPAAHSQADPQKIKITIRGSKLPHLTCRSVILPRDRGVSPSIVHLHRVCVPTASAARLRSMCSLTLFNSGTGIDSPLPGSLVAFNARRMYSIQTRACAFASIQVPFADVCSGPVLLRTRGKSTEDAGSSACVLLPA